MRLTPTRYTRLAALTLALFGVLLVGSQCPIGLSPQAVKELQAVGVDKYVGDFSPAVSVPDGDWVKHTFDIDGGSGPICIAGTPLTMFTRERNPAKLLIYFNGGGACWQNFYFCSILADDDAPFPSGVFVDSFDTGSEVIDNPFADWSMLFVSYCDGSVFSGDNDVIDASFPFGPVRFHRGLRNATAAIDLAKAEFPNAQEIMVAGSSAGGVGATGFVPFLVRLVFGNFPQLTVFNDAGPVAINLFDVGAIAARAADWQFGQFYPSSCTACDPLGQATAIIDWRLDNDGGVRESFYDTDGDATNRFFLSVPTQAQYRNLIVTEHGALNAEHPNRYKRMIRSGDDSHTQMRGPLFYVGEADGVPIHQWMDDFVKNKPGWVDIVEDFVPLP